VESIGDIKPVISLRLPRKAYSQAVALWVPIWRQVTDVACLGLDMVNSSQIDYQGHRATSAKIYGCSGVERR
jgi:hypothetical protein